MVGKLLTTVKSEVMINRQTVATILENKACSLNIRYNKLCSAMLPALALEPRCRLQLPCPPESHCQCRLLTALQSRAAASSLPSIIALLPPAPCHSEPHTLPPPSHSPLPLSRVHATPSPLPHKEHNVIHFSKP